jgi:hypothetical protein
LAIRINFLRNLYRACSEDFRHVRTLVFGEHDERQLQDMRGSGAVEADAGGTKSVKSGAAKVSTWITGRS